MLGTLSVSVNKVLKSQIKKKLLFQAQLMCGFMYLSTKNDVM